MSDQPSTILQGHLDRLRAGDPSARDALLALAYANLRRLAARMFGQFPAVRRWEDTDDVSNNAALRLWKALEELRPPTARDFYRLAALQIRRELLDLTRHYKGPEGLGARHESALLGVSEGPGPADPSDATHDPGRLLQWTDFHRQVELLPEEERDAFDLLFYQGLPHAEAAGVLGVSEATLRRRWLAARLRLQEAMENFLPS
jgi:RNA polymerase sigma-70 factor (ECF subfamily)